MSIQNIIHHSIQLADVLDELITSELTSVRKEGNLSMFGKFVVKQRLRQQDRTTKLSVF